ncbi:DNA-binding Xre family transcriptional regulator [Paenibacillus phyllosphaerae]|uniref:DNA-binding Xre family transcriptional regulator n=1 Tax=Paenibacillus phyllosphaerae TaxID=274593 RepID=A0A7W5B3M3_9BACL|nr:helix-turn-helix domain-containing protein [Paenibacillus phyllosphaerae]MBB3113326.1 DNA-binding Xre family transcriptional regulator [Paenibacillus phyllosphaerae]
MPVFETIFKEIKTPMAILKRDYRGLYVERCNDAFTQLVGYTEAELTRLKLDALFQAWSESSLTEKLTPYTLRTKQNQKIHVKISCRKNSSSSQPTWICTAHDESAKLWIQAQMQRHTVLISGIINAKNMFERADKKLPYFLLGQDIALLDRSIMSIIHEEEQGRVLEAIRRAVLDRRSESLSIRTKWLGNEESLEVTFSPFYHSDNTLNQFAYVVTDFSSKEDNPSVKLKIMMARCNLSAVDLSESTGISVQTISKLRNGRIHKPQRLTALLLASELGVKPQDIWE